MTQYSKARCAAITKAGNRCTGRWATAFVPMYAWNPTTGEGEEGLMIVLCHRHRHWTDNGDRAARRPIVHGWLGRRAPHFYYMMVYAGRTGERVAKWWFDRRRPAKFGVSHSGEAA